MKEATYERLRYYIIPFIWRSLGAKHGDRKRTSDGQGLGPNTSRHEDIVGGDGTLPYLDGSGVHLTRCISLNSQTVKRNG